MDTQGARPAPVPSHMEKGFLHTLQTPQAHVSPDSPAPRSPAQPTVCTLSAVRATFPQADGPAGEATQDWEEGERPLGQGTKGQDPVWSERRKRGSGRATPWPHSSAPEKQCSLRRTIHGLSASSPLAGTEGRQGSIVHPRLGDSRAVSFWRCPFSLASQANG